MTKIFHHGRIKLENKSIVLSSPFLRVFPFLRVKYTKKNISRILFQSCKWLFETIIKSKSFFQALLIFFSSLFSYLFRFSKPLTLKIYDFYLKLKKFFLSAFRPATAKFRYIFSNRYIAHALIIALGIFTLAGNLAARETITEGLTENIFLRQITGEGDGFVEEELIEFQKPNQTSYINDNSVSRVEMGGEISAEENFSQTTLDGTFLAKPSLLPGNEEFFFEEEISIPNRSEIVDYTVEQGDTVSKIAEQFGIDMNTILWENHLGPRDYIQPGDKLRILPENGITHTVRDGETLGKIAEKYDISVLKIQTANHLTDSGIIHSGENIIIPDAAPIITAPTRRSTVQRLKDIFVPPAAKIAAGTQMIWPTVGRRINQYFSWRHKGIDIDGEKTSPIYASDDGVVFHTASGWSGGYGLNIRIDHGNGIRTLYAHLDKILVDPGQRVKKGDVIGMMGTTGRSTGVHLHFEVMNTNNARSNPFNYVK